STSPTRSSPRSAETPARAGGRSGGRDASGRPGCARALITVESPRTRVRRGLSWWGGGPVRVPEVRVMGVDPGPARCGSGAVEGRPGAPLSLVGVGVVRTPADHDIGARLLAVEAGVERWLDEVKPDAVAVERVFAQHNVRTVMGTAQAAAIAIVCAARRGLPVALYTPIEVKAAITGSGTADKRQ